MNRVTEMLIEAQRSTVAVIKARGAGGGDGHGVECGKSVWHTVLCDGSTGVCCAPCVEAHRGSPMPPPQCRVPHNHNNHTTPYHTTPHHTTPHHTTPHHTTPHHTTPHHTAPHHTTPHHTTPQHTTQHSRSRSRRR